VSVQDRCRVCAKHTTASKIILDTPDVGLVESNSDVLVCLETVLVSVQDKCPVYAKCTTGLEIVLDTPDGSPRRRGSCGMLFFVHLGIVLVLVQDRCMICGSEIILDTPDATLM
jgi:hypothetical protein